jgi:hypothetical protein
MSVGILALGAANSRSIVHALRRAGADAVLLEQPEQLSTVSALVLPGVANLGYMIQALDRGNWRVPILAGIDAGLPTLGICAGFQLLCTRSEEAPGFRHRDEAGRRKDSPHGLEQGRSHLVGLRKRVGVLRSLLRAARSASRNVGDHAMRRRIRQRCR